MIVQTHLEKENSSTDKQNVQCLNMKRGSRKNGGEETRERGKDELRGGE